MCNVEDKVVDDNERVGGMHSLAFPLFDPSIMHLNVSFLKLKKVVEC